MRRLIILCAMASLFGTGCITSAGGNLGPIDPIVGDVVPDIEQSVGDFEFTLEGGKMVTSNKMGRTLNDEILKRWVEKGYIASHTYVPSSEFSGHAGYNLVLTGSQYGESSVVAQFISGLTLYLFPYTVDTNFDLQYTLENPATGEKWSASAEDSYHTTVELLLVLAAPVALRGQNQTFDAIADHLYEQLRSKGAFSAPVTQSPAVAQ